MLQDSATSLEAYERFVRRVVATGEVWGLESPEGWAMGEAQALDAHGVMPFWSDRACAARAAQREWARYEPTRLSLSDFIEHWLNGLAADGLIVGTNWDAYDCGLEILPLELSRRLVAELAANGELGS